MIPNSLIYPTKKSRHCRHYDWWTTCFVSIPIVSRPMLKIAEFTANFIENKSISHKSQLSSKSKKSRNKSQTSSISRSESQKSRRSNVSHAMSTSPNYHQQQTSHSSSKVKNHKTKTKLLLIMSYLLLILAKVLLFQILCLFIAN